MQFFGHAVSSFGLIFFITVSNTACRMARHAIKFLFMQCLLNKAQVFLSFSLVNGSQKRRFIYKPP